MDENGFPHFPDEMGPKMRRYLAKQLPEGMRCLMPSDDPLTSQSLPRQNDKFFLKECKELFGQSDPEAMQA